MVDNRDLPLSLRFFLMRYRWRRIDPVPCAPLSKPLAACRVALVSSAGLVAPDDEPFDEAVRGGDFTHRVVAVDTPVATLEEHHRSDSFDHAGIEADRNMGLPLDRLHELAAENDIGSVAPRHISLMGSITAPGRLVKRTLPQVAEVLASDEVDVALMIPV
ncbi:MAG: glycine/sarcosine/betaine reductase selenoprotein B family protein [Acidobacteriota bacterium]